MATRPLRDEILSLPEDARLRLLEEVWDSLAAPAAVPAPTWHVRELEERLADPTEKATEPWEDLKRRLERP